MASSGGRPRSTPARIDHLCTDPHAGNVPFLRHYGDMTDSTNLIRLISEVSFGCKHRA
jgi:GDP-D-mannose dehydratase